MDIRPVLPDDIQRRITRAGELRIVATWANRQAAAERVAAARILWRAGYSLRDIGLILGVSYQRARQLTRAAVSGGER